MNDENCGDFWELELHMCIYLDIYKHVFCMHALTARIIVLDIHVAYV